MPHTGTAAHPCCGVAQNRQPVADCLKALHPLQAQRIVAYGHDGMGVFTGKLLIILQFSHHIFALCCIVQKSDAIVNAQLLGQLVHHAAKSARAQNEQTPLFGRGLHFFYIAHCVFLRRSVYLCCTFCRGIRCGSFFSIV